jgi:hypothetical protein
VIRCDQCRSFPPQLGCVNEHSESDPRLGPFINTSDNTRTYGAAAGNRLFLIFYWNGP